MRVSTSPKGFTLLELLVVISIIGTLTLLSLFAYTQVRQQAAMRLAVDEFAVSVRNLKDQAKLGRDTSVCRGVSVTVGKSANFVTAPVEKDSKLCDAANISKGDVLSLQDRVEVQTISMSELSPKNIVLFARPASGDFEIYQDGEKVGSAFSSRLGITFRYGTTGNVQKQVTVDPVTGITQIVTP